MDIKPLKPDNTSSDWITTDVVTSSRIKTVMYSANKQKMVVTFTNGQAYEYEKVSEAVHIGLITADSIGGYFNLNIKDNKDIPYKKL